MRTVSKLPGSSAATMHSLRGKVSLWSSIVRRIAARECQLFFGLYLLMPETEVRATSKCTTHKCLTLISTTNWAYCSTTAHRVSMLDVSTI